MISPLKRKGCGPQGLGSPLKKKGPCWEGYEMVGMKKKGGRQVPNCVPVKGGKPSPAKKKYTQQKVDETLKTLPVKGGKPSPAKKKYCKK